MAVEPSSPGRYPHPATSMPQPWQAGDRPDDPTTPEAFISVSRTLLAYDEALRLVRDDTERRHLQRLRNGCVEEDRTGYGNGA